MPNWCENLLTVTGPRRVRRTFAALLYDDEQSQFNFERRPLPGDPPDVPDPLSRGVPAVGIDVQVKQVRGATRFWFDSPWDPPRHWLRRVALAFPQLSFHLCYADYATGMYGELNLRGDLAVVDYDRGSLPGAREFTRRVFGWDPGEWDGWAVGEVGAPAELGLCLRCAFLAAGGAPEFVAQTPCRCWPPRTGDAPARNADPESTVTPRLPQ